MAQPNQARPACLTCLEPASGIRTFPTLDFGVPDPSLKLGWAEAGNAKRLQLTPVYSWGVLLPGFIVTFGREHPPINKRGLINMGSTVCEQIWVKCSYPPHSYANICVHVLRSLSPSLSLSSLNMSIYEFTRTMRKQRRPLKHIQTLPRRKKRL